jgi:hypothetical protein
MASGAEQVRHERDLALLFEPASIRGLRLPNRVLMAPMEKNLCAADGSMSQRYIDWRDGVARRTRRHRVMLRAPGYQARDPARVHARR